MGLYISSENVHMGSCMYIWDYTYVLICTYGLMGLCIRNKCHISAGAMQQDQATDSSQHPSTYGVCTYGIIKVTVTAIVGVKWTDIE